MDFNNAAALVQSAEGPPTATGDTAKMHWLWKALGQAETAGAMAS